MDEGAIEADGGAEWDGDVDWDVDVDWDDDAGVEPDAGSTPKCAAGFVVEASQCVRERCDEGYALEDGECVRNPCLELDDGEPACAQHATCEYRGAGEHVCRCEPGYTGDGTTCERDLCVPLADDAPVCGAHQECAVSDDEAVCTCEAGFADCDASADDGCEVDLRHDAAHCGACALACADGLSCLQGACEQRVSTLAPGYTTTLALRSDGTVLGAGAGALLRSASASTSMVVVPVDRASAISVSTDHACTLRSNGAGPECWGSNAYRRLGSADPNATHVQLSSSGALAISAGTDHTCLVASTGRVYCWGQGVSGEFGDGVTRGANQQRSFADATAGAGLPVLYVEDAVDVGAGRSLNCARVEAGRVYCWGFSGTAAYAPELVRGADNLALTQVVELEVATASACARRADGSVACWSGEGASRNRFAMADVSGVRDLAVGSLHTCALLDDGSARCWGNNSQGQLGSGDTLSSDAPLPVLFPEGVTAVSIHASHAAAGTCARASDGAVYCWGFNYWGQLALGDTMPRAQPVEVTVWP